MSDEFWIFLIGQALTAAGVYAAIRADLREALTRLKGAEGRLERLDGIKL